MAHGEVYATEFGWDATLEAFIVQIVAAYAADHDPDREAAWIADIGARRVGCVAQSPARRPTPRARPRRNLTPQDPHQPACPPAEIPDELAYALEARAEVCVAELDREHRILQGREGAVSPRHRLDRGVDQVPGVLGWRPRGRLLELAPGQAVAGGELRIGPLRAAVGDLHGPEELFLELIGGALIESLVRGSQERERRAELIGRLRDSIEQLLPRFRVGDRHTA